MKTFEYFRGLHGRGWKRWQLDRMWNMKPWYVPRFLWIRYMRRMMHKVKPVRGLRHFTMAR